MDFSSALASPMSATRTPASAHPAWSRLDLDRLVACHLVAERGSLKKAAAVLKLSVPAVSARVSTLETDLGVSLFRRYPHKLELTPLGRRFLGEIKGVLQQLDEAIRVIDEAAGRGMPLTVSMGSSMMAIVSRRIGSFLNEHPQVHLTLQINGSPVTAARVAARECDVGVGFFGALPPGIERHAIERSEIGFFGLAAHALARRKSVALEAVAQERLLMIPGDSELRHRLERRLPAALSGALDVTEVGSCQSALDLAATGAGIAMVHCACARAAPHPGLRALRMAETLEPIEMSVIVRRDRQAQPVVARLVETLRQP